MSRKARVSALASLILVVLLGMGIFFWYSDIREEDPDSPSRAEQDMPPPQPSQPGDERSPPQSNQDLSAQDKGARDRPGDYPREPAEPVGPAQRADPVATASLEKEASRYIDEEILAERPDPIPLRKSDTFAPPEQQFELPDFRRIRTTPEELLAQWELPPGERIRVAYARKRELSTTLAELRQNPDVAPGTPLTLRDREGQTFETTLAELERSGRYGPDEPLIWIREREVVSRTTPDKLTELERTEKDTSITVLEERDSRTTSVAEIVGPEAAQAADVFYVRRVRPGDDQGLWGIIQDALEAKFREGVALSQTRGVGAEDPVRLDLPPHADERLPDGSSSFLGKTLYRKTRTAYVYNFLTDRMSEDRDLIYPGQQLLIVPFTHSELVDIYKHFAREEEKRAAPGS